MSSDQESDRNTEDRSKKKEKWEGEQEGQNGRIKGEKGDRKKQIQLNKLSKNRKEEKSILIAATLEFLFAFSWILARAFCVCIIKSVTK